MLRYYTEKEEIKMKKIYSFTLDDEVPLSDGVESNIKAVAFWLFDSLANLDRQIVCFDDDKEINDQGLIKNDLYDIKINNRYVYTFASEGSNIDNRMYEPFVLNNKSFAFTVNENSIDDGEIAIMLENVLRFLKLNYKFNIDSITYDESNIKNRYEAIDKLFKIKREEPKAKKRVKLQVKTIMPILSLW